MKYFIFSIFLFLSVACSVKTIRYETDKYARIVDPQGANIYYSSDLKKSIKHYPAAHY